MKRPDFFIVGAFKAGTTALYEYLRVHPQVFMPALKEPHYFGADLHPRYARMSEKEYLDLFEPARPDQRAGEATPWYLYSHSAAGEIHDFNPEAKIIVMLRNPVDVMYAQHSQLLFNQREDLPDFAAALAAEPARLKGERIPVGALRVETLYYRQSVRFAEQLKRYLDVFNRDSIHLIVHDDLRADTAAVYRDTLQFLQVDPTFKPAFGDRNANRRARFGALQRLVYRPPRPLRGAMPWLRRAPFAHRLRDAVVTLNSAPQRRPEMDPGLRRQLTAEFAPQVAELGAMIGRDLSSWSAGA